MQIYFKYGGISKINSKYITFLTLTCRIYRFYLQFEIFLAKQVDYLICVINIEPDELT